MSEKKKPFWRYGKHYLMIAPFFILFIVFYLAPLVYGFYISFEKWDGVHPPVFVGLTTLLKLSILPIS